MARVPRLSSRGVAVVPLPVIRGARRFAPLVPIIAAMWVWAPLRNNYFFADDFVHLYDLASMRFQDFVTQVWAGHVYLLRNAVFRGMFGLFGPDPRPYFWSVLLTHGVNALLLYRVIDRITRNVVLACFGATLWAVCPTLQGALGWYSVYGHVLLTTIVLGVMSSFPDSGEPGAPIRVRTAVVWTVLIAIGSTCFGIGVGVAAVFPLVCALALPRERLPPRVLGVLLVGAAVNVAAYVLVLRYRFSASPEEREVFLAPSVLGTLPGLVSMEAHLVGFGAAALLFDIGWQQTLPSWMQAAGAGVLLLLLVAAWLGADEERRRVLLAPALLVVGAYGAIAAGRAKFFTLLTVDLASAATAARYHYLPLAALTIVVSAGLGAIARKGRAAARVVCAATALWMAARGVAILARPVAISHWDGERAETAAMLAGIRDRIARTPPGTVVHIENQPFGLSRALPTVFPGWAAMFVVFFPDNTVDGRPVRFVVSDADYQRAQARGGRIAALVEHR
jgi:hypothetical protein